MLRVEQTIVGVRDTGTHAVSMLHNELMAYKRAPATEVVQPMTDDQLQADLQSLRSHLEAATARLRTETTTLSNDVKGQLLTAEQTIAYRLDASDARLPALADRINVIEQQLPSCECCPGRVACCPAPDCTVGCPDFGKCRPLRGHRG